MPASAGAPGRAAEVHVLVCSLSSVHCVLSHLLVSTLCDPMDWPGTSVHSLLELAQTHVHQIGEAINHLILCSPLLLLPSIFPSIRVFSNESALCIRWPKYWRFRISPSNEYSRLISFSIDWFDLLAFLIMRPESETNSDIEKTYKMTCRSIIKND